MLRALLTLLDSFIQTQQMMGGGQELLEALLGGTVSEQPEHYEDASSVAQVDTNTAPFLIFHSAGDEILGPVSELRLLVDALHESHIEVIMQAEYPRMTHFDWLSYSETVMPETLAFLGRHLQHTG